MPGVILKTCPGCLGSGVTPNTGLVFYTCQVCKGRGMVEDKMPLKLKEAPLMTQEKHYNLTKPAPLTGADIYNELHHLETILTDLKTGHRVCSEKKLVEACDILGAAYDKLEKRYKELLEREYKNI